MFCYAVGGGLGIGYFCLEERGGNGIVLGGDLDGKDEGHACKKEFELHDDGRRVQKYSKFDEKFKLKADNWWLERERERVLEVVEDRRFSQSRRLFIRHQAPCVEEFTYG